MRLAAVHMQLMAVASDDQRCEDEYTHVDGIAAHVFLCWLCVYVFSVFEDNTNIYYQFHDSVEHG